MKRQTRTAVCLLLGLLLSQLLPGIPARAEERTLHIASAAELRQLAVDCAMDSYSDGLTVILDADLELSGEKFYAIPSFNGVFQGGGHRISGMRPAGDGSNQALFRYLGEDAQVLDLHVTGTVAPTVGQLRVGGIAGSNHGLIRGCSFEGNVSGLNYVGGITGENFGTVEDCRFAGRVDGKRFTGGIAGYSEGLLRGCANSAMVNTSVSEAVLSLEDITTASTVPLELLSVQDENVVADTGGIVGYSKGIVQNCVNRGTVGYQHFGYNVGGIAGRQCGYLTACKNFGQVLGRKDVAGIVGQMEPYLALVESVNLADELLLLNTYMNAASGDLAMMSDEMQDALDEMDRNRSDTGSGLALQGSISHAGEEPTEAPPAELGGSIEGAGGSGGISHAGGQVSQEQVDGARDYIHDSTGARVPEGLGADEVNAAADGLYGTLDGYNQMLGIMSSSTGYLADDLNLANNQFSRVLLLMSNALNGDPVQDVFDDVSDQLDEDDVEGRVSHNENYGVVEADNNVGGVIGAMGIEYEFDMEDTLITTVGANGIVNNSYDAKCVSSANVNHGAVTAKKDRVGSVAGSSEMGVILDCEGYGPAESSEGGYVGGVVGYSGTVVRNSYAMCALSGGEYVGGIAGYGREITDCVSLVQTNEDVSACLGAIAGWADMTGDAVTRNLYVHEYLGAVDGISYREKAVPVSYEELLAQRELPESFRSLRLSFLADGQLIAEISVPYGGSVPAGEIPPVPEREGCSGRWTDFDREHLRFSATVEAVYTAYQSALAAETQREGSERSVLLLEGAFGNELRLSLEPYEGAGPLVKGGRVLELWRLRLEGRDLPEEGYTVRFLPPELGGRTHKLGIFRLRDGAWQQLETGEKGSYVSFPADGDTVVFAAVELSGIRPKPVVAVAAAVLAAAGITLIGVLAGRRRRHVGAT